MARKKKPARGRPPLPDGQSRASVLTVRLQPGEREALDAIVDASDKIKSVSELVRNALLYVVNGGKLDKLKAEDMGVEPHR